MDLKTTPRTGHGAMETSGGCCGGGQHSKTETKTGSERDSSHSAKHEKFGCCCAKHS